MSISPTPTPLNERRNSPTLSLTDLPALVEPTPPSNTLLITNLANPETFLPSNLQTLYTAISACAIPATFSPLKSFRRIIATFATTSDAIAVRAALDGETVLGARVRVYFGAATKLASDDDDVKRHLQAPAAAKLFFISPPPSPPVGWEMKNEEPPNREVHAEDLTVALARLNARGGPEEGNTAEAMEVDERRGAGITGNEGEGSAVPQRTRSSTLVFDPADHGGSPHLPAIAVEDTSASPGDMSPMEGVEKKFVHTSRPPVELMET